MRGRASERLVLAPYCPGLVPAGVDAASSSHIRPRSWRAVCDQMHAINSMDVGRAPHAAQPIRANLRGNYYAGRVVVVAGGRPRRPWLPLGESRSLTWGPGANLAGSGKGVGISGHRRLGSASRGANGEPRRRPICQPLARCRSRLTDCSYTCRIKLWIRIGKSCIETLVFPYAFIATSPSRCSQAPMLP